MAGLHHLEQRFAREAFVNRLAAQSMLRAKKLPFSGSLPHGGRFEVVSVVNGQPVYYITHNSTSADTISTDEVRSGGSLGLLLNGSGVTLLEWDGGSALTTHQEFGGRVVNKDGAEAIFHSTHVAGTMVGAGVVANALGMAPAAGLHSYDWNDDTAEMAAAAADGHQISNHSYGRGAGWTLSGGIWYWYGNPSISQTRDYAFGFYDTIARDWDELCYNAPYFLPVKSAGNDRDDGPPVEEQPTGYYWNGSEWKANTVVREVDGHKGGYDNISTFGVAKNILTVAAVEDIIGGWTAPEDVVMTGFSSWGPADDGRIKPDISANGSGLFSADSFQNDAYWSTSGTSMAAPSVSGSLGLLIQHYADTHGGGKMLAATIKGLAIHTADEAGPDPGPDYMFGWGLMNTRRAVELISADVAQGDHILEADLDDEETFTYMVYSDGSEPLKVTMAWTDVQGPDLPLSVDPTTRALVNDLDLRVSNGTTYFPWVLDKDNPADAATTGDNSLDNVEQVIVPAGAPGVYTITVSHKGTLTNGGQAFSLIMSGQSAVEDAIASLTISPSAVAKGQTTTGTVTLTDPAPSGGQTVSLESSDPSVASVPASIVIGEGETSGQFTITAQDILETATVTITADNGINSASANVTVLVEVPELENLTLNPQAFGWWEGTTATVTLDAPAPAGGAQITLMTSSTRGSVQPSVTIPEGQTSATVSVTSNLVDPDRAWNFRVFAFYEGERSEVTATVYPTRLTMLGFRWNPIPMGHTATMTIRTNWPAPPGGWLINLSSSNPGLVNVPATATIPQGSAHVVVAVVTGSQAEAEDVIITANLRNHSIQNTIRLYPQGIGVAGQ